jgi:hypothetical protein
MAIPAVAVKTMALNFAVTFIILNEYNKYIAIQVPKVRPTAFIIRVL